MMATHGLKQSPGGKLFGLELLRFVAACAVLIWHYQHFAFDGTAIAVMRDKEPLYALLWPFYEYGLYGVQVFWSISGFIFFWRYRESVAAGEVSGWQFFVLRFSRLYPLHFITLLLVALLQAIYAARTGHYFVYAYNDGYHFLLQLFMASHWGMQTGFSFNGPIWSISVEVLVYAIFYVCLRLTGKALWGNLVAVFLSMSLHLSGHATPISDCIGFFYAGGIGAWLFLYQGPPTTRSAIRLLAWLVVLGGPCLAWTTAARPVDVVLMLSLLYVPFALYCIAQPFTLGRRTAHMVEVAGNLTYASYLVHFPLQVAIAFYFAVREGTIPVYHTGLLLFFMSMSFALAYLVYRYFERPAQTLIRTRFGRAAVVRGQPAGRG